ncbi:MAG: hypothetical protein ACK4TA_15790, partial [Saprospiraceae bacterium]
QSFIMKDIFVIIIIIFVNIASGVSQSADNEYCGSAEKIKVFFLNQGMYAIPIKIIGDSEEKMDTVVNDFANLKIEIENSVEDIYNRVLKDIQIALKDGFFAKGFITKNENFCEKKLLDLILHDYYKDNYDASIIMHIWDNPDEKGMDLLFTKFNQLDYNKKR